MAWICQSIKICDQDLDKGLKCGKGWGVCGSYGILLLFDLFSCSFFVHFFQIFFSLFFHVHCSLWGLDKTQETKAGKRLHLCEEAMEWEMEGCVTSFFVVWLCFNFLDAMKVISISLI